jgi:hypothetical protein
LHKTLLIEEFHLTLLVPLYLASAVDKTICQTLEEVQIGADLQRGVRAVVGRYPALSASVSNYPDNRL